MRVDMFAGFFLLMHKIDHSARAVFNSRLTTIFVLTCMVVSFFKLERWKSGVLERLK